jgi:tripartite-type tricarboxylate transporter receptor subunit TctC
MTAATPHVKSGKVIAIAQTRQKRATSYPNVPTMHESGFPGFEATTWYGLVGPGKLPTPIARRMNEDMNRVFQMPDVQEKFVQFGAEDGGGSMEKFAIFMRSEAKTWAKVVKEANVKAET